MRIGLSLSGGGFRATLFHLGVIRFLHDARLLSSTVYISSVSGGSVLGAHLVLNWERYTDPCKHTAVCNEIRSFTRRDVRGRIVRRWPFYGSTTGPFQKELSRIYRGCTLMDLHGNGRPLIEILSTSLSHGFLVAFRGDGSIFVDRSQVTEDSINLYTPISIAVAASAAYPALFKPVELNHRTLRLPEADFALPHAAADGGLFDNLGVQMLRWTDDPDGENLKLDHILVSNAGAPFVTRYSSTFSNFLTRQMRAFDVVMARNADLLLEKLRKDKSYWRKVAECHIHDTNDLDFGSGTLADLHRRLQKEVPRIRTNFDAFSAVEGCLLERHGYLVAKKAWQNLDPNAVQNLEMNCDVGMPEIAWPTKIPRLRKEIKFPWLWDWRDWLSWMYASVAVVILLALAYVFFLALAVLIPKLVRHLCSGWS